MGYLAALGFPSVVSYIAMQKAPETLQHPPKATHHGQNGAFYIRDYEKTFQFSSSAVHVTHDCTHAAASLPKSENGGCRNSSFLLYLSASCVYSQLGLLTLASPATVPSYYSSLIRVSQHSSAWQQDLYTCVSERRVCSKSCFV